MQQKTSVSFDDWKEAFKQGFDGFILKCGSKTAEDYILKFEQLAEVSGKPVYRSDGVHVRFKRDKPTQFKASEFGIKKDRFVLYALIATVVLCIITLIVAVDISTEQDIVVPIEQTSKNVLVQGNIIPRECYIIPSPIDRGYSLMVIDANDANIRFYIEVNNPDSFIMEYLEKK